MKKYPFILFAVFCFQIVHAQYWSYITNIGGKGFDEVNDMLTDQYGNVYISGTFEDSLMMSETGPALLYSNGNSDAFLLKLDATGQLLWAQSVGGKLFDVGKSLSLDQNGNVFMGGYFSDTIVLNNDLLISNGGTDIFIAKYDSSGVRQWLIGDGSSASDQLSSLYADTSGIWLSGEYNANFQWGSTSFTNKGNSDVFLLKLDEEGTIEWYRNWGGSGSEHSGKINIDELANIYLSFQFTDSLITGADTIVPLGNGDVIITKVSDQGNVIWTKVIQSLNYVSITSLSQYGDEKIGLTGYFKNRLDIKDTMWTKGETDAFILFYDTSGSYINSKQIGQEDYDYIYDMSFDENDNIYIIGSFKDSLLRLSYYDTIFSLYEGYDIFIAKYDSAFQLYWAEVLGGSNYDYGLSIEVFDNENIWCSGTFEDTLSFTTDTLLAFGYSDVWLSSYINNTPLSIIRPKEELNTNIKVFPNPTKGVVYFSMSNIYTEVSAIMLTDITGKHVYSFQPENRSENYLDVSSLKSGIYFLNIYTSSTNFQSKIILYH